MTTYIEKDLTLEKRVCGYVIRIGEQNRCEAFILAIESNIFRQFQQNKKIFAGSL